jgi:hypothetical protein
MKQPQDLYQECRPRAGSANLSIQALQIDRMWRLFPVQPQSRLAKTRIQEATADAAQLERWASEIPGCGWGLATGAASSVFVLEADTTHAGSTLRVLCQDDWSWKETLLMSFRGTGYAFFRWPVGRAMRSSGNLAPGLRLLGEGNSVLVPPTASRAYLDPEATIAAPPHWLHSAFAGVEEQSSGKVLVFPKISPREISTSARSSESCAKLLPFGIQADQSDPRYRVYVYMSFELNRGRWQVQFMEKDLQTTLPRTLSLATAEEMIALAARGGGLARMGGRQALDLAIANRRGGIFLTLTTDQYSQLQLHCRPGTRSNDGRDAFSLPAGLQNTAHV